MTLLGEGLGALLSLGVVLGLVWLTSRFLRKRAGGTGQTIRVLGRAALGRSSAVVVVQVADRALVLGVTDQQVCLLGDAELEAFSATLPDAAVEPVRPALSAAPRPATGPLAGSVLSPRTWRQAVEALRERSVRR